MQKKKVYINYDYFKQHPGLYGFITKIRQILCVQHKDKKQIYMETEQQPLQNQELFNMSIQLFKEFLQVDDIQLESYYKDQKFIAFIKCIQRVGLMLSKFYQDRQQDFTHEIQKFKSINQDFRQKLTNYMEQNEGLKQLIEHLQNDRKIYDQKLNNSQHELQRGKSQIQIQIHTRQCLLKQNENLLFNNQNLQRQNSQLKQIIENLHKQLNQKNEENNKINRDVFKLRKDVKKLQQEYQKIKQQKAWLQKQVQSLQALIQQKDQFLLNKNSQESYEYIPQSAQQNSAYLQSIKVVKQVNQQYGSDRDIMKGIQNGFGIQAGNQPIMTLKFGESRSISETSQKSETSIINGAKQIVQISIDQLNLSPEPQKTPQAIKNTEDVSNVLQTQKKKQIEHTKKIIHQQRKSSNKIPSKSEIKNPHLQSQQKQPKVKKNSGIYTPIPKNKQRQKSLTSDNLKKELKRKTKQSNLHDYKPYKANVNSEVRNKKYKQNASVILKGRTKSKDDQQFFPLQKKGKFQHSQSVQDLYYDNQQKNYYRKSFEQQLIKKQKYIQSLKHQNRSVRQLIEQQSQKLTQAEHEYQQQIQKLKSQLQFYKKQFRKNYAQLIEVKSLNQAYKDQIMRVNQQIQNQRLIYQNTTEKLKLKCKNILNQQIQIYKQKYQQMAIKMNEMENQLLFSKTQQQNDSSLISQDKSFKKSNSNSLFAKQVKHHSYNPSQQYSQINFTSANHSKNASFIIGIDQEDQNPRLKNQNIKIIDYDESSYNHNIFQEHEEQRIDQEGNIDDLKSFCQEKQTKQQEVQTQRYQEQIISPRNQSQTFTLLFSESNSSKFPQGQSLSKLGQGQQMNQQLQIYNIKSLEQLSKIKLNQQRIQKIKALHFDFGVINEYNIFSSDLDKQATIFQSQTFCSSKINEQSLLTKSKSADNIFAFSDLGKNISSNLKITSNSIEVIIPPKEIQYFETQANTQLKQMNVCKLQSLSILAPIKTLNDEYIQTEQQENDKNKLKHFSKIIQIQVNKTTKRLLQHESQTQILCKQSRLSQVQTQNNSFQQQSIQTQVKLMNNSQTQTNQFKLNLFTLTTNIIVQPSQKQIPSFTKQNKQKNDHNQSFINVNQNDLNEILNDMSNSFDISQRFIQTLKKKLLKIHQNLKQIQENNNNVSSQSDPSQIQKKFKNIYFQQNLLKVSIDQKLNFNEENNQNITQKTINLSNQQLYQESIPNSYNYKNTSIFFQGNVKTSKASTKCSISTPLDSLSPNNNSNIDPYNLFQIKEQIVTQFYEIKQIQSQNVDSLSKIQMQGDQSGDKSNLINEKILQSSGYKIIEQEINQQRQNYYESLNVSVNRSDREYELSQSYKDAKDVRVVTQFQLVEQKPKYELQQNVFYINSPRSRGKKVAKQQKSDKIDLFTPKLNSSNQLININENYPFINAYSNKNQEKIKSPKGSKQIKYKKDKKYQKPKQLQNLLCEQQYQFLNRRYHIKKYEFIEQLNLEKSSQCGKKDNKKDLQVELNQQKRLNMISNLSNKQIVLLKVKKSTKQQTKSSQKQQLQDLIQQNDQQFDIIALNLNKIISIKNKYVISSAHKDTIFYQPQFKQTKYPILSLGNQQITVDLQRQILKYSFKNKVNYYDWYCPQKISSIMDQNSLQDIQNGLFKIEQMWRYKIR